jgi:dTDP-4-dehydrorhamnose 3,5-epimerase
MKITNTPLPGVVLVNVDKFSDSRGSFHETWHKERYAGLGLPSNFVQDNVSSSKKGVLRGLRMQNPHPQGKLVQVLQGEAFDVAVDLRVGSPTFGKWFGATLTAEKGSQMFIPEGFAHGFLTLSDVAIFSYKCTNFYNKAGEKTIRWDDPDIGIIWPLKDPLLSDKDRAGYFLKDIPRDELFTFGR